jgi:hypothetical protein
VPGRILCRAFSLCLGLAQKSPTRWPPLVIGILGILFFYQHYCIIRSYVLPPCRIIGQLRISRQTLTFNFSQENMQYII